MVKTTKSKKQSGGSKKQSGGSKKQSKKQLGGNVAAQTAGTTVKKVNPWLVHVSQFRVENQELSYKECLVGAKKTYKKN